MSGSSSADGRLRDGTPTTYYEASVRIPGCGDAPDRCRDFEPVGHCLDGHVALGRSSCGTRYCPDHWRDWCENSVVGMVARLAAYRHAQEGAGKRAGHVVASPPQDRRYSKERLYGTRSDAYDAFEAAGVPGGAVVTHPYRQNDRGQTLWETAQDAGEVPEGMGLWRFLREVSEGWEDLKRYIEPSPHYHAVAPLDDVDGDRAPDGWVVERIRTFEPFYIRKEESYEDMVSTAYYILTHGAAPHGRGENRATLTYFGALHPACFDPEEELTQTEWKRIQMMAERVVKEENAGSEGEETEETCSRSGCEAEVVDLFGLRDRLNEETFKDRVYSHRDGHSRWLRLRGLLAWTDGMVDNPPPGTASSEKRLLEWLEMKGQLIVGPARQSGMGEFA